MKKTIIAKSGGRRKGKTFAPKYSGGTRKIQRSKKQKGG